MAGTNRTATRDLSALRALADAPHGYGFYHAVRLLECAYRDKPRLGQSVRPVDDPIRLAQDPAVTFAPSTLSSFTPGKGNTPPRLATYFFGLFGPHGPLPLHLTEYARDRQRHAGDATFVRFSDVFHHRMLSLFCARAETGTHAARRLLQLPHPVRRQRLLGREDPLSLR